MIDSLLHARLRPIIERRRRATLWRHLAAVWTLAAGAAWWLAVVRRDGTGPSGSWMVWLALAAVGASVLCWLHSRLTTPDVRRLARALESRHPDLDGRLLTAIQQEPDRKGDYNFLQERLFEDAVRHSVDQNWESVVPSWQLVSARGLAAAALAAFFGSLVVRPLPKTPSLASLAGGETTADGVTVTPGDTAVERGSSVTVMVRFDQSVPPAATLVVGASAASERRIPLTRGMADPIFGGTMTEVTENVTYRIDYAGRRTRDFKVSVYDFPRLENSDAELTPPAYTRQPTQRIEDTRRVSAVEGTLLSLTLQLNKPVASASLVPKSGNAKPLVLTPDPARAVATLAGFPLTASQSYELRLVDADGRQNKVPDLFVLEALPNRTPDLKLATPRRDLRPSALEELTFQGSAWDDFGVLAYGLGLSRGGGEAELIEFGRDVPAQETATFRHLVRLESLAAKPDDLISWYVWADDIGPDGQPRRTKSDLFFGEVRPFDEIFREGAGMEGAQNQPQEGQQNGQQGAPAARLAELQKQIINATWKLDRTAAQNPTIKDIELVRDSQQEAINQATAAAQEEEEPMRAGLWEAVTAEMETAHSHLSTAVTDSKALAPSLASEQSAYQALLKLRESETEVNRSQNAQQSSSGSEQQRQAQIDELDLEQSQNAYETQRQAQPQQNAERKAQMQVQNRLEELARRQEDVNNALKELQTELQAADTEARREELRRQLKRLEDEQRQMLADMDEVRQRMERPEVQSQMSRRRQQLDQTRQDAQRAAEAAAEGQTAQALAAGTRAQRQLEDIREDLRRQSSSQLAEELRQMRSEARDIARQQEAITQSLAGESPSAQGEEPTPQPKPPSLAATPEESQATEKLEAQRKRTAALVERATAISDESEGSEPLVSRQLYDALRQFSQTDVTSVKQAREDLIRDGDMTQSLYQHIQKLQESTKPGQALSLTSELLRAELQAPAQRTAEQAGTGLNQLRAGVEKAAEKILGDDTAALQAAEKELEALAAAVAEEAAASQGDGAPSPSAQASATRESQSPATQARAGGPSGEPSAEEPQQGDASQSGSTPDDASQGDPRMAASAGTNSRSTPGSQENGRQAGDTQAGNPQGENEPGRGGQDGNQPEGADPSAESRQAASGRRGAPSQQQGAASGETGSQAGEQEGAQAQADGGGEPTAEGEPAESGSSSPAQQASAGQSGQRGGARGQRGSAAGGAGGGEGGGGAPDEGGDRDAWVSRLLEQGGVADGGRGGLGSPIAGEGFTQWSDRLREVEEMVDFPDLRNSVSSARERARAMRVDMRRDLKKPDWAVVELEILKPLVEVRRQVREELRRRSADDTLAPVDRDPVPEQFADLVRRYYEELGSDPR